MFQRDRDRERYNYFTANHALDIACNPLGELRKYVHWLQCDNFSRSCWPLRVRSRDRWQYCIAYARAVLQRRDDGGY